MSTLPILNVTAVTCLFRRICLSVSSPWMLSASSAFGAFVNFETPPVHPVALNPDVQILAVCNLPDARIELFDVSSGSPVPLGDVPVGVDPVSVRFLTTNELWVVNHISCSLSVVDIAKRRVVATIQTGGGPADVVFAEVPRRAFVSCAPANLVQIFDAQTRRSITNVVIDGERPKSMATSADDSKVYVAIFESGNGSTIIAPVLTDVDTPLAALTTLAAPANELTFTVVPCGCGRRLGVDRDGDGYLDRTELDEGFSPHDSASHGTNTPPRLEGPAAIAIHPEQSVSIPFGAVDLDSPAQRLTFRLLTNAPSGAVIDASSGLFTWTPWVADQVASTQHCPG